MKKINIDPGYSNSLSNSVGFTITDINKLNKIAELLNKFLDKITQQPTLVFAAPPPTHTGIINHRNNDYRSRLFASIL